MERLCLILRRYPSGIRVAVCAAIPPGYASQTGSENDHVRLPGMGEMQAEQQVDVHHYRFWRCIYEKMGVFYRSSGCAWHDCMR